MGVGTIPSLLYVNTTRTNIYACIYRSHRSLTHMFQRSYNGHHRNPIENSRQSDAPCESEDHRRRRPHRPGRPTRRTMHRRLPINKRILEQPRQDSRNAYDRRRRHHVVEDGRRGHIRSTRALHHHGTVQRHHHTRYVHYVLQNTPPYITVAVMTDPVRLLQNRRRKHLPVRNRGATGKPPSHRGCIGDRHS